MFLSFHIIIQTHYLIATNSIFNYQQYQPYINTKVGGEGRDSISHSKASGLYIRSAGYSLWISQVLHHDRSHLKVRTVQP